MLEINGLPLTETAPGTHRKLAKALFKGFLEPVHDLLSSSARNARWMNCKLVLGLRSQFFHSLRFFSSQAKLRSTLQRLGMTLKVR
ncbi:hypothetical protein BXO439_18695, partial [Xanthomonas oryzae pv. oryzae]